MNHIHRLMQERDEAIAALREVRDALTDLEIYLTSPKFHEEDYVYVKTDMLPKIASIRFMAIGQ